MNKILWIVVLILSVVTVYFLKTDGEISIPKINKEVIEKENIEIEGEENKDISFEDSVVDNVSVVPLATTKPSSKKSSTQKPSANILPTHDKDGNLIVRYTVYGFDPETIEIKTGDAVRFLNANISSMWVKAQTHPTAKYFEYAALNQGRSSYIGESYIFTFTQVGNWGYFNLNKDKHKGVVMVVQ